MGTGGQGGMSSLYGRARRLLVDGDPVVADVTACRADDRAEWIAIARNADATTRIVVFTTPVEVCVARNARRPKGRRVPDERMAFYAGMHTCLPTIVAGEDWDEVVMVDGR